VDSARFPSGESASHGELRDQRDIAQLFDIGMSLERRVVFGDLALDVLQPVLGALQAQIRAHDADVVPHQAADFIPHMMDHDHFVGVL
jgi:hypothetical protein